MTQKKIQTTAAILLGIGFFLGVHASAHSAEEEPAASNALSFKRRPRIAGELHRSMGSKIAQKRQGVGFGLAALFPLRDGSGFDLGVRYSYIDEAADREPVGSTSAFTQLTFVFDYFVWPEKLGGLYVGGEVGVTDPAADQFFSVFTDYVYVGKIGYELTLFDSRWSAALELRRAIRDSDPIRMDRETIRYSDSFVLAARYQL
jgi:hypothetical protein